MIINLTYNSRKDVARYKMKKINWWRILATANDIKSTEDYFQLNEQDKVFNKLKDLDNQITKEDDGVIKVCTTVWKTVGPSSILGGPT